MRALEMLPESLPQGVFSLKRLGIGRPDIADIGVIKGERGLQVLAIESPLNLA